LAVTWKKLALEDDVILKSTATAKGDLLVASASGVITRLGIGTDGYLLYVNTDTPGWKDPTSLAVATHATTHKSGGADAIKLNELAVPTSAVGFNGPGLGAVTNSL